MRLEELKNNWWTRLDELVGEIEEMGYGVLEQNREYIVCFDEEDDSDEQYQIRLGGTERTIVVEEIEEI